MYKGAKIKIDNYYGVILEKTKNTIGIIFPWNDFYDYLLVEDDSHDIIALDELERIIYVHTPKWKIESTRIYLPLDNYNVKPKTHGIMSLNTTNGIRKVTIKYSINVISMVDDDIVLNSLISGYIPKSLDTRTELSKTINSIYVKEKENIFK